MTDTTIALDRMTLAYRSDNRWAVARRQADGTEITVAHWQGPRKSLLRWCEENHVHPTRDALAAIDLLPEASGFRERG